MKKPRQVISIIALMFAFAQAAFAQAELAAGATALSEPVLRESFEPSAPEQAKLQGWPQKDTITWESEEGNHFLRLKSQIPGKPVIAYKEIHLPANIQALELRWKERVTGLVRGEKPWFDARIMMEFMDAGRGNIQGKPKAPNTTKDTDGWVERSVRFDVPDNARILKFMPSLLNVYAGVFDIDDIVLRPVAPIQN